MYEVVNQKLGIKACRIGDLGKELVFSFLNQWEEGAKIGELTLFFEEKTGALVLNKDNPLYESYLKLSEEYLDADNETRKEIRTSCKIPGISKTLDILEMCVISRHDNEEMHMVLMNEIPGSEERSVLKKIAEQHSGFFAQIIAFNYGVIQGKRMERRRKRQSLNFAE